MNHPVRIQRKRTKGWRMPENTVYVGRPSQWGNPYRVIIAEGSCNVVLLVKDMELLIAWAIPHDMAINLAIEKYESGLNHEEVKKELKGKNLACFCPLDQPCHADVLLEIANT